MASRGSRGSASWSRSFRTFDLDVVVGIARRRFGLSGVDSGAAHSVAQEVVFMTVESSQEPSISWSPATTANVAALD
jgi:hypothetical protein